MRDLLWFAVVAMVLLCMSQPASADCRHKRQLANEIELDGAVAIEVLATSGWLKVEGVEGADRISARGEACSDDKDRVGEIEILMQRVGDRIQVIAAVPFEDERDEWRIGGLNLELRVPDSVPLTVSDSSGDLSIRSVSSLELTDSSGDINLEDIAGDVVVARDSSGDLDIRDAGDITIRIDSSGDIFVEDAASLTIDEDTSGNIRIRDIRGNVVIGRDTSGSINASGVGGNFGVAYDSSGEISVRNVAGEISIPEK